MNIEAYDIVPSPSVINLIKDLVNDSYPVSIISMVLFGFGFLITFLTLRFVIKILQDIAEKIITMIERKN